MVKETYIDKTTELIPISTLNDILFDEDVFSEFIIFSGVFEDINKDVYLEALKQYMRYIVQSGNEIDEDVFRRMELINKIISLDNNEFDYAEYLKKEKNLVGFEDVSKILNDEYYFQLFMNFSAHKSVGFKDLPIIEYLKKIDEYFNAVSKIDNVSLDSEAYNRYQSIKKKYALDYKNDISVNGEIIDEELDEEFERDILSNVDLSMSKMAIAFKIYVELNKRCCFDINYLSRSNRKKDLALDLYVKEASYVNKENPSLVCRTWAVIYQKLLIKCGFNAKVNGYFHKFVEFDCDGTLMQADGTQTYPCFDGLYFNDLFRCRLGLKTCGFKCIENDKDISLVMQDVMKEVGYNPVNFQDVTSKAVNEFKNMFMDEEDQLDTFGKLECIKYTVSGSKFTGFEKMQYFKFLYVTSLTEEERKNMCFEYIGIKVTNTEYKSGILISYKNEDGTISHTVFEESSRSFEVTSDVINEMLNSDMMVIFGDDNGFYEFERNEKNGVLK